MSYLNPGSQVLDLPDWLVDLGWDKKEAMADPPLDDDYYFAGISRKTELLATGASLARSRQDE
jgi:hypothetical protein